MLEKFLKLTPRLSKESPFFDTSGETMGNNITNRGHSTFLKLQMTHSQALTIFSVPKNTSRNTPESRKLLFFQQELQKIQFFDFFRERFTMAKHVSTRKTTFLQPKSAMKARGYSLTK